MPKNVNSSKSKKNEASQDLKKKSQNVTVNTENQADPAKPELSDRDIAEARKEILNVIHQDKAPEKSKPKQAQIKKPAITPPPMKTPPPPPKYQPPAEKTPAPPVAPKPAPPIESVQPRMHLGGTPDEIAPKTKKPASLKKKLVIFVVAGLLGIIIVALTVFGVGLYRYDWDNQMMKSVVKIIPYPAAIVKYHLVRYSDFNHDLAALKQYYEKQASLTPDLVTRPTEEDFRSLIIDKLIKDKLLAIEAKAMNIVATKEDINKEVENLSTESGGREALEATLKEMYNWMLPDFEKSILRSYVLRQKVQERLAFDDSISYNQNAKTRIEEAAQKLRDGETFEEVSKLYNEDTTSDENGDLGYIARSDVDEKFADAAFALNEGEISPIVQTSYGYHIIKLVEKPKPDDTANNGTEGEERYHFQHILVYTLGIDKWLSDKEGEAKIYNFIK